VMYIDIHIYIYLHMLMYKKKDLCPYISTSPLPWSCVRCFSNKGCLPQIIITMSSQRKGATSPSVKASSISMSRGRDPVIMKLFIRPQSQSLRLTE
jgi:hypothetical protein